MKKLKRNLEEGAAVKSMAGAVAASWALPSDFPPFRMRNEYTTEETALFKVFEEHPAMGLGSGTNEQLRSDTHIEMIFQDVLRNRISYQRNPNSVQYNYNWVYGRDATTGSGNTTTIVYPTATEFLNPSHAVGSSSFLPHGSIQFAENDSGITGFWVDDGPSVHSTVSVNLTPAPSATSGNIFLYIWDNGIWKEYQNAATVIAQSTYVFTMTRSAYIAVQIRQPTVQTSVAVSHQGTCGCWGRFPAPYVVTNAASIESVRTLGHSMLVKNVTNVQTKQGAVTGVQPGKSRPWTAFSSGLGTEDVFSVVRDYAGAANSRPLETGFYTFVKPTEEEDLKLREAFTVSNAAGSNTVHWTFARTPILRTEYVVVAIQAPSGNSSTGTGQNLLVRTDVSGEYETSNQFFNVDKPRAEPAEWRDGMEGLASMQQFYENPTHWKRILSTIGSVASVGGRILSLFGPKGAAVGVPMSMAGDIMRGGFQ